MRLADRRRSARLTLANAYATGSHMAEAPTYNQMHADWANMHQPVDGARVLVVGCNTGGDCRYFVDMGAAEVHGVDVVPEIGQDFPHERVTYHRMSAESMALPDNAYDLVFCFATMEHVPRIDLAFPELARVTAPGGLVYCVASPLWRSRNGHHLPQYFGTYPWFHLRMSLASALEWACDNRIHDPTGRHSADEIVRYIYDRENFNMTPSADYVATCAGLRDMDPLRNDLDLEPEDMLPPEILSELEPQGYGSADLRAVTHTYIARKKRRVRGLPRYLFPWRH